VSRFNRKCPGHRAGLFVLIPDHFTYAVAVGEIMDAETLRKRLTDLENLFCEIRDHPKATIEIQGMADHGQGRVETLKAVLHNHRTTEE
jgi:hypothetical protein